MPAAQRDVGDLLLPYRKGCFDALSLLLKQLPSSNFELNMELFKIAGPTLLQMIESEKEPPVLTAAALNCMGEALWYGVGNPNDSSAKPALLDLRVFGEQIAQLGGKAQPAWTIREASALCFSQLVSKMHAECFRQHVLISCVVNSAGHSLKDRKYWRVRCVVHGRLLRYGCAC
jgi:hypothetical protein